MLFRSAAKKTVPSAATTAPSTAATTTPAQPQGTEADLDTIRQQTQASRAAGQAQQQQAIQQMQNTAKANQAAANTDAAIKAAADAAKAKPAFQQTASDKLAIKRAADKGIRENLEKHLIEFERFLSMPQSLEQPQIKQPKPVPSPVQPQNSSNEVLDLWSKLKL